MSTTYELRHKDHTVLLFQYNPVPKVLEIIDARRLPVPMENPENFNSQIFFEEWYSHRVTNVRTREKRPEFSTHRLYNLISEDCVDINYGANLADHYWICDEGSPIKWSEINYYENEFDAANENSLWTAYGKYSPDNHTNGNLRKFWTIKNGVRYLAKYNSLHYDTCQLGAYNEIFSMKLLQKAGIPCAEYCYANDEKTGEPYSLSKCITDTVYELVPAFLFMSAYPKQETVSFYDWFLAVCKEKLGINVRRQVDEMICLDYLIANEDRHWNNFALLRNSETLEYVGLAPLYDHEYSMRDCAGYKTRTFHTNPDVQLQLIDPAHCLNITENFLHETWDTVYGSLEADKKDALAQIKNNLFMRFNRYERILHNEEIVQDQQNETAFQMYTR